MRNKISPTSKRRVLEKAAHRCPRLVNPPKCEGCGNAYPWTNGFCSACEDDAPLCVLCDKPMLRINQRHPLLHDTCYQIRNTRVRAEVKKERQMEMDRSRKRKAKVEGGRFFDHPRVLTAKRCREVADDGIVCPRKPIRGKDYCYEHSPEYEAAMSKLDDVLSLTADSVPSPPKAGC